MPLGCGRADDCTSGYTLMLHWNGREPADEFDITWSLTSVLRYPDRDAAPPSDSVAVTVDRAVNTAGADRERLLADASGTIESRPGDPFIEVPIEPADGAHLINVLLRTWQPSPTQPRFGVPTTGVVTLSARSADGAPLRGPVRVSVVTQYPAAKSGAPRNEELAPGTPEMSFTVWPSMGCYDLTLNDRREDGRCSLPFDVFVQPPDEATGPIILEWSISLVSVSPDGLTLEPGDLEIVTAP
jgi:hypothetical protein